MKRIKNIKRLVCGALFLFILSNKLQAQDEIKYVYLDSPSYEYIDYLINSGQMVPDFVFQQPYDSISIKESKGKKRNSNYFKKYWDDFYSNGYISCHLQIFDKANYKSSFQNKFKINGGLHIITPHISLGNRTIMDQEYKDDPNYAGDLSESKSWIYGRTNDAYVNIHSGGFQFFLGRMSRNWGPVNSSSLVLSNNPYSYDHFLFSYTYKKLKISLLFGRLEDLDALVNEYPDTTLTPIPNARKYLVGHRLDINFSKNFQIALTEMATYGGENREIEISFLNPMTYYYGLQRNDRKLMSGLWAVDVFYKLIPRISLYSQFLLDDIVINNDPEEDDRKRFPDRLGLMFSIRSGDLLFDGLNTNVDYVRIWNRTYQSLNTWENYHYRSLGLGYPCASCEEVKFKIGYWGLFPLYFQNETIYGRYGSVGLTDLFMLEKEKFPVDPVTNNLINTLWIRYFNSSELNFFAKIKYSKNKNHYLNRIDRLEGLSISVGAELTLATGISL